MRRNFDRFDRFVAAITQKIGGMCGSGLRTYGYYLIVLDPANVELNWPSIAAPSSIACYKQQQGQ